MRLRVQTFGDDAEGIVLRGDPRSPEPTHARIAFPGGDVDIARVDGAYWVHIRVNRSDATSYDPCAETSVILGARVDSPTATKTLDVSDAYHFAVKIGDVKPPIA